MIILTIFLVIAIITIHIFTNTMIPYPKSDRNIINKSMKNPDLWIKHENNEQLLICLHGMNSEPEYFRKFSQHIDKKWDIYAPALPNEIFDDQPSYYQWEDLLRFSLHKILVNASPYKNIILCGHSQSGSIALALAPSLEFLKGIIIGASPIQLPQKHYSFLRKLSVYLSGLGEFIPSKGLKVPFSNRFQYGLVIHSFRLGLKLTKKNLSKINTSTLLVYHKNDPIVNYSDGSYAHSKIKNSSFELLDFDADCAHDKHMIFSFPQQLDSVYEFIKKNSLI